MLQYREFPKRTALIFTLFSAPTALCMYVITGLVSGSLFELSLLEHHGLLGYGALSAVFMLPITGLIVDRVRRLDSPLILTGIAPTLFVLLRLLPFDLQTYVLIDQLIVISSFGGFAAFMILWTIRINQSIIAKYRGRTVALFLVLSIILTTLFSTINQMSLYPDSTGLTIPSVISLVFIGISIGLKPWRQPRVNLAASGTSIRYFLPTTLIMASYMLWYLNTKLAFQQHFIEDPSFVSLSQLVNYPIFETALIISGVIIAGILADTRGRKPAFSFVLLMMGLLTIFGSIFYSAYFQSSNLNYLYGLLGSERFIEGYLLGLCLCLIWPELGSVRTKGIRLALIWFFFLGFMTLLWAVDLNILFFGLQFRIPDFLSIFGGQVAIFTSLIALYLIGPLPVILGREIEIEELSFDFDDRQIRKTVDAYVGTDDFASIKSQLDIIDAGADLSDDDVSKILGNDSKQELPLRTVNGIGDALEKKLTAAGYTSAQQLAGETAQRLSQKIEGLSLERAEKILNEARKSVKKAMKRTKKK